MMHRWMSIVLLVLVAAGLVSAQDVPPKPTPNDDLTIAPIGLDQVVVDTITDKAVYDWWQLTLQADDVIVVEMQAFEGLSPLIGILDPNNELVARSDTDRPSEPDGHAIIQYRTEVGGLFTISATREGNTAGLTTGPYQLRIRKINVVPERENDLAPIEFRCDERVATNTLMLNFEDEIPDNVDASGYRENYRLSIYGQNDFAPLILADADLVDTGRLDCDNDTGAVLGNTYTLPGEPPVTITEAEQEHAAQLSLLNSSLLDRFGEVRFTLGSLNAATGRYVVVVEGLKLQDANDVDTLIVRAGPLASSIPLMIYVVGENPGRLDLSLEVYDQDYSTLLTACDDAGRSECADVPAFVGAGATFLYGDTPSIIGDRFDAGVRLPAGSTDRFMVDISSSDTGTYGAYTVFIIGELPAHK